ncbi:MAG: IS3 family transposase [Methyloprofundus sp.]|nr:IS3 family transposase [Methyloprofundus sp.]
MSEFTASADDIKNALKDLVCELKQIGEDFINELNEIEPELQKALGGLDTIYATGKHALYDVSDYIGWYNHQRMHSTNDNYSPVEYENQWNKAMQELDKKWASLCTKKG